MKALHRLFVFTLFLSLFPVGLAEPLNVFFGTGGRGAEGIYHATFNPDNGRFSPAKLAAKIGSPGFLFLISTIRLTHFTISSDVITKLLHSKWSPIRNYLPHPDFFPPLVRASIPLTSAASAAFEVT